MKRTTDTRDTIRIRMLRSIERQATEGRMHYNPLTKVTCPHCGATMQALDAKAHVRAQA